MKKVLIILLMVLLMVSCSLEFRDADGFHIFGFGLNQLTSDNVLIQSHDGFVIEDVIHNEGFFDLPVTIENTLNRTIDVKITTTSGSEWVVISDEFTLGE